MKKSIIRAITALSLLVLSLTLAVTAISADYTEGQILSEISAYELETVKTEDKEILAALLAEINTIYENAADSDKERLIEYKEKAESLVARINDVEKRLYSGDLLEYKELGVTQDTLEISHLSAISSALADASDILAKYETNLTTEQFDYVNSYKLELRHFLDIVERVSEVQKAIDTLPDPKETEPYDELATNYLNRAQLKYDMLSISEKKMVNTTKMEELRKAIYLHEIIQGANVKKKVGSSGYLVFSTNHTPAQLYAVLVNGETLDTRSYIAESNGSIILTEEYLKTLEIGYYELTMIYEDGDVTTSFAIVDNGAWIWITVAIIITVVGIGGVVVYVVLTKKNRTSVKQNKK